MKSLLRLLYCFLLLLGDSLLSESEPQYTVYRAMTDSSQSHDEHAQSHGVLFPDDRFIFLIVFRNYQKNAVPSSIYLCYQVLHCVLERVRVLPGRLNTICQPILRER